MLKKIKNLLNSPFGRHLHSFAKTYITVFIGTYLAIQGFMDLAGITPEMLEALDKPLFTQGIIIICAKASFIAVLRNIYKLLTD